MTSRYSDWPIVMGSILGGDVGGRLWGQEVSEIALASRPLHKGVVTPFRVNVVFHINGPTLPNTFTGVRVGSLSRKKNRLVVESAIYPQPGDDKQAVILSLLSDCLDVAEEWARKKGIAESLPGLRGVINGLPEALGRPGLAFEAAP